LNDDETHVLLLAHLSEFMTLRSVRRPSNFPFK